MFLQKLLFELLLLLEIWIRSVSGSEEDNQIRENDLKFLSHWMKISVDVMKKYESIAGAILFEI